MPRIWMRRFCEAIQANSLRSGENFPPVAFDQTATTAIPPRSRATGFSTTLGDTTILLGITDKPFGPTSSTAIATPLSAPRPVYRACGRNRKDTEFDFGYRRHTDKFVESSRCSRSANLSSRRCGYSVDAGLSPEQDDLSVWRR